MKYIFVYVERGFIFGSLEYYYDKGSSIELGNIDKMYVLYNTSLWIVRDNDVYYSKFYNDKIKNHKSFDLCMKNGARAIIDNGYFDDKEIIIDHIFNSKDIEDELEVLGAIAPYLNKVKGWK